MLKNIGRSLQYLLDDICDIELPIPFKNILVGFCGSSITTMVITFFSHLPQARIAILRIHEMGIPAFLSMVYHNILG